MAPARILGEDEGSGQSGVSTVYRRAIVDHV